MQPRYFLWHASQLLAIDVDSKFRNRLNEKAIIFHYMDYYQTERSNSQTQQLMTIRSILQTSAVAARDLHNDNALKLAIIPLLVAYFKEESQLLYIIKDVSIC